VLPAGRANYQVLSIGGRFGEIGNRRLCGRGGGKKSKKEALRNEGIRMKSKKEEVRTKKLRHTNGLKS